jgi:hypothetical protein
MPVIGKYEVLAATLESHRAQCRTEMVPHQLSEPILGPEQTKLRHGALDPGIDDESS